METKKIEEFRKKIRVMEREIENQLESSMECCSVSFAQCHAILELGYNKQITIKKLSEILDLDKSTLSRTIDNLVNLGFVDRIINPDDRRYMDIELTAKGIKSFKEINNQCNKEYYDIFKLIPKDKQDIVIEGISIFVDAMLQYRNKNK